MSSVLDLIGNTPIVQIRRLTSQLPDSVRIFAKLERFNPGGSVKDRPAWWMIRDGLKRGLLTKDKIILDSTSGNTGIALAMIGAVLGIRVKLVMPGNVSDERKRICRAFGAELIFSDPLEGSDGAILLCRQIHAEAPELYFKPDQYNNPMNPKAHEESTGPEIWRDTKGKVTHIVASLGTSGTLVGISRYFRRHHPHVRIVAAEPDSPFHGIEGLKHIASSIRPGIYDPSAHDEIYGISTEEAYDWTQRLAREEGILAGQSSGCAFAAALRVAQKEAEAGNEATIVVIFPDGGEKYLSTPVFAGSSRVRFAEGI